MQITSGPTYTFEVQATSRKPLLELSFYTFDFGPCFVMKQPLPQTVFLEMTNRDDSAISVETDFVKTAFLDFKLEQGQVLLPQNDKKAKQQKVRVPVVFTPRDFVKYDERLTLNINNLHSVEIQIKGEGVPLKLELEKSEDQNVDFGV